MGWIHTAAASSAEHGLCAYKLLKEATPLSNQSCLDSFCCPPPPRGDWHWSVNLCTPSFPARMTNTICMAVPWKQLLGKQYSCWWPGPWARMVSWGRAFQDLETSADTASPSAPTKRQPFSRWPKFCFLSIRSWLSMCLFLLILLPH